MEKPIKVFKFGGASVKDTEAVLNVIKILSQYKESPLLVIVSAMGKTTNKLEEIFECFLQNEEAGFLTKVTELEEFHYTIIDELFDGDSLAGIKSELSDEFKSIRDFYRNSVEGNTSFLYDQLIPFGEILSTKIVHHGLMNNSIGSEWCDARLLIRTDNMHQKANVEWPETTKRISEYCSSVFANKSVIVTQGFIGSDEKDITTTLGREGSDFTAGIFAYALDAEEVIIWKDVPGMLNADPKFFENTVKLDQISFKEAIELSYYGASVIHPKTIKPLQNKNIPLYVKSFINPGEKGTTIQKATDNDDAVPSFIFKKQQVLFSIMPKDFSFLIEKNLSDIFSKLAQVNAHINIMQNSALSFSFLLDENKKRIDEIKEVLEDSYIVKYNTNLELVTIRHYDQKTIDLVVKDKEILMEQRTRTTARFVLSSL